jgi:hypothetical protein
VPKFTCAFETESSFESDSSILMAQVAQCIPEIFNSAFLFSGSGMAFSCTGSGDLLLS